MHERECCDDRKPCLAGRQPLGYSRSYCLGHGHRGGHDRAGQPDGGTAHSHGLYGSRADLHRRCQ